MSTKTIISLLGAIFYFSSMLLIKIILYIFLLKKEINLDRLLYRAV